MKYVQSVGIITYIEEGDILYYLLLLSASGCWDFPKGHIEVDETKKETALRELKEETGLVAQLDDIFEESLSYVYISDNNEQIHKTDFLLIGKTLSSNIVLSFEHTDYAWLTFDETLQQISYDDTRELFKKAHDYIVKLI